LPSYPSNEVSGDRREDDHQEIVVEVRDFFYNNLAMRIVFERTGGFAGLTLKTSLEESSLPLKEARHLHRLLDKSRFFELPLRIDPPDQRPDRFQYRLTVEKDNCIHTVRTSEDAIPRDLLPLVEWLTQAARQNR
jgi:hypothetical protein